MPSLVSPTERANLTGIFNNIFDTFARNIVIVKEPIKILVSPAPSQNLFGFGENQASDAYTYSGVTGIFPATIRYGSPESQSALKTAELTAYTFEGPVTIKVRPDCRDFINTNKTLHILVDGRTFFLDTSEHKQAFLDSAFYVFTLKATK
jgi:hypothetical protein